MISRVIENKRKLTWKTFFFQWEWMLVFIFFIVHVINASLSPFYMDMNNLTDATMVFLDKAFIVLPMALVIILGDIDISVASTIALSSVVLADLYQHGVPLEMAIVISLLVGTLCGFINGILIVKFKELSAVIITLSTMILYRGIAYILLEDQAAGNFPDWFSFFGWGYVKGIPFILIAFAVCAVVYGVLLHKTVLGRRIYAMGNNMTASRFSGIKVDKIKVLIFTLVGLMSAIAALFITSKMGSTRPNIATGYELEIIAMTVLGGVSTSGGKGRIIGVVLAVFLVGFLRYGLGLVNVPAQVQLIIIGLLLILAVMGPKLKLGKAKT